MSIRNCLPILFLLLIFKGKEIHAQSVPKGVSEEIENALRQATHFMNHSMYDSAQYVITRTLTQTNHTISSKELYYLRCYEAEIMYYNALFEQGLNVALHSMDLAKELNDDLLLGNSHNFVGLFLMNIERTREAAQHFLAASRLIPAEANDKFMSLQYHATGNLGECYLKLNMPDSAIFYSLLSGEDAAMRNRERGLALAQANIAEAFLLKEDYTKATSIAMQGYEDVKESSHRDVVQVFCMVLMRIYEQKSLPDSVNHWMNIGLVENGNSLNTDLSRIGFIQKCIDIEINQGNSEAALNLLRNLNSFQQTLHSKQQSQRIAVLKDYYEQNNKLALAKQLTETQKSELKLRTAILSALAAVAVLLVVLIFIFRKNSRQKQHIAAFKHKEELQIASQELELKSLKERLEALFSERNRIASDLHDDIGAALSSIRIYSGAAQKHFHSNPKESEQLIQRINESSTGMMDRMSDIVWSINPKNDNGQSLVMRMKSFAGEVLGSLDIKVNYKIDEGVEDLHPTTIVRRNLFLIFKEAITNISKYSGAKDVVVVLEMKDEKLHMSIEDNGVGFNVVSGMHGNGLSNMNLRAEAIGAVFHITSHKNKGTQLMLLLPLAKISDANG